MIVEVEGRRQGVQSFWLVLVGVGVGPALEQGVDEAFCLAVGLGAVGAGLLDGDCVRGAGLGPAAFEAGAVVGEQALDADAVRSVEAHQLGQEGCGAIGCFVGVDGGESQSGVIVDRHVEELPAGSAPRSLASIVGDAVARREDTPKLLAVDMDELTRVAALLADNPFPRRPHASRERPCRRKTACTVEAAIPSAQPITCGPSRSSSRARRIACPTLACVHRGRLSGRAATRHAVGA